MKNLTLNDRLSKCRIVSTDLALEEAAIRASERFEISHWDAAIIAAADTIGAGTLYTEDFQHGQRYGTVLVENPFRDL